MVVGTDRNRRSKRTSYRVFQQRLQCIIRRVHRTEHNGVTGTAIYLHRAETSVYPPDGQSQVREDDPSKSHLNIYSPPYLRGAGTGWKRTTSFLSFILDRVLHTSTEWYILWYSTTELAIAKSYRNSCP